MEFQVACIIKRGDHFNPHERIEALGGNMGYKPEEAIIEDIESRRNRYYVLVRGYKVYLIVSAHDARKYLKTEADSYSPDNLLALPGCQR
jgi:hypothetical protein